MSKIDICRCCASEICLPIFVNPKYPFFLTGSYLYIIQPYEEESFTRLSALLYFCLGWVGQE